MKKHRFLWIKTSKLENRFAKLLKSLKLNYKRQYKIKYKYYDFYLPNYNLLIEIDGNFWHGNKKMYPKLSKMQLENKINDLYKDGLAKTSGYRIIRFWEHEINNNPIAIKQKLLKEIGR